MPGEGEPRRSGVIRGNVLALGLVSLLTDASSEMVVPLLPLFLTGVVGGGAAALGLIEGLADGVASVLKLWSGRMADRVGRNRPFVVGGYTLSSVVRPLMALAAAPLHVLLIRVADRVGKGLRSSARDALLAGSVPAAQRGAAFGFHRGMDHAGAVIGPLLAIAILTWWTDDLRVVFAMCAVPAALAVLVVWAFVGEVERSAEAPPPSAPPPASEGPLWRVLLPVTVFALGNGSDTFLLLRAGADQVDPRALPALWVGLHLVKSLSSAPGGLLADRIGPRRALLLGWGLYAVCYGLLAWLEDPTWVIVVVLVYGLHHGLSESAEKVLVAGLSTARHRGEAFGWYHLSLGVAGVIASAGFGAIWAWQGPSVAFALGAVLAGVAAALVVAVGPEDPTSEGVPAG